MCNHNFEILILDLHIFCRAYSDSYSPIWMDFLFSEIHRWMVDWYFPSCLTSSATHFKRDCRWMDRGLANTGSSTVYDVSSNVSYANNYHPWSQPNLSIRVGSGNDSSKAQTYNESGDGSEANLETNKDDSPTETFKITTCHFSRSRWCWPITMSLKNWNPFYVSY